MTEKAPLIHGDDGIIRCFWAGPQEDYLTYHDEEWGNPVKNDTRLFEKICLEGFQSGLSWYTILSKRENFREAFHGFEIEKVAAMGDADIEKQVQNAGIIRHRGKIKSTINNAQKAIELIEEKGSLAKHFWSYEPQNRASFKSISDVPGSTDVSTTISKDLKKRGWSFVGPTTAYAFMQAMGMVNDHLEGCYCHARIEKARSEFIRP